MGCSLPNITEEGTTIDASSRWDTAYDRPGVEIIGGNYTGQRNVFISGVVEVYILSGTSNAISNNYIGAITWPA